MEAGMVTLVEALAAERAKRQNLEADAAAMKEVARAVLGSLAEKLNATPVVGWMFLLEDQAIRVFRTAEGSRNELCRWTMDDKMQLVCGEATTEWITSESYARVIDEAVAITARLIVDAELGEVPKVAAGSAGVMQLPRRS
jgi:hypothetical protein